MKPPPQLIPWVKGQSGNPSGRPKGTVSFAGVISEAMEKVYRGKTTREAIISNVVKRALLGDQRAAEWLVERVDGKVREAVDHDVTGEVLVRVLRDRIGGAAPLRLAPPPEADPGGSTAV